ncbi:hypothetical protein CBS101457_003740 [Exobasidium rhododendri]|nr:hypothetical protein CBS101457_003740 [Exobasidium rhododendri]
MSLWYFFRIQIPGVTLPFSHIIPLTIALSFTQIIHEAGHAICGSLYSWTPLRMGLILLFPCIPGAFVILPHEAFEGEEDEAVRPEESRWDSTTKRRLRTISAGVWHNALTSLVLALFMFSGLSNLMHRALWEEVNGMLVESVDPSSPLLQHMPIGTLISRLNDDDLTVDSREVYAASARISAWDKYLLEDGASSSERLGWCVASDVWSGR